jgi:hypothetical protein
MTPEISISGDTLIVEIKGADRIWALKSRLEIPLSHVTGAGSAAAEARQWLHGLRLVGTEVPGVLSAGRFYSHAGWVFWDVHHAAKAIGIDLQDEHYSRLVVEADDPDDQIRRIREAAGLATV